MNSITEGSDHGFTEMKTTSLIYLPSNYYGVITSVGCCVSKSIHVDKTINETTYQKSQCNLSLEDKNYT